MGRESIVEGYFEEQAERAELRIQLKGFSGQLSGEAKAAFEEIEDRRKRNG